MTVEQMAVAIGSAGYAAWSNTLIGNAPPVLKAYHERAKNPQPGDLVVETSSFGLRFKRGTDAHSAVGRFVKKQLETMTYDVDPDYPDDPADTFTREVWYIEPIGGGEVVTWENCEWVAIPSTPVEVWQWKDA